MLEDLGIFTRCLFNMLVSNSLVISLVERLGNHSAPSTDPWSIVLLDNFLTKSPLQTILIVESMHIQLSVLFVGSMKRQLINFIGSQFGAFSFLFLFGITFPFLSFCFLTEDVWDFGRTLVNNVSYLYGILAAPSK